MKWLIIIVYLSLFLLCISQHLESIRDQEVHDVAAEEDLFLEDGLIENNLRGAIGQDANRNLELPIERNIEPHASGRRHKRPPLVKNMESETSQKALPDEKKNGSGWGAKPGPGWPEPCWPGGRPEPGWPGEGPGCPGEGPGPGGPPPPGGPGGGQRPGCPEEGPGPGRCPGEGPGGPGAGP